MNDAVNSPSPPPSREQRSKLLKWKRDVIKATSPATTRNSDDLPLHLIVLAILGLHRHAPRLGHYADVNASGVVTSVLTDASDRLSLAMLGRVTAILAALNRLADHCKLSDDERTALFLAFRNWIAKDQRANDPNGLRVH